MTVSPKYPSGGSKVVYDGSLLNDAFSTANDHLCNIPRAISPCEIKGYRCVPTMVIHSARVLYSEESIGVIRRQECEA